MPSKCPHWTLTFVAQNSHAVENSAQLATSARPKRCAQNSHAFENSAQLRLVPKDVQAVEISAWDAHIVAQNSEALENSAQLRLVQQNYGCPARTNSRKYESPH